MKKRKEENEGEMGNGRGRDGKWKRKCKEMQDKEMKEEREREQRREEAEGIWGGNKCSSEFLISNNRPHTFYKYYSLLEAHPQWQSWYKKYQNVFSNLRGYE